MSDIYQSITENDAAISSAREKIAQLQQAIQVHLSGEKAHIKSYKIGDREIEFSVSELQKEINRLTDSLNQLHAHGKHLEYLKNIYEGKPTAVGRVFYRG